MSATMRQVMMIVDEVETIVSIPATIEVAPDPEGFDANAERPMRRRTDKWLHPFVYRRIKRDNETAIDFYMTST